MLSSIIVRKLVHVKVVSLLGVLVCVRVVSGLMLRWYQGQC